MVFDEETRAYYYARLNAAGNDLVSSGLEVGKDEPGNLERHLRRKPEQRREIAEASPLRAVDTGEEAAWEARIQAVGARRAALLQAQEGEGEEGAPQAAQSSPDPSGNPITGNVVGVTLLVQFPDDPATGANDPVNFPVGQQEIVDYCNQLGYSGPGNNTGSVRDYFRDQSLNALDYTMNVTAIVTMPNPRNYYNFSDYPTNNTLRSSGGGPGGAGFLMMQDAVAALGATNPVFDGVSLESGTNYVLSTNILFAGPTSGVWAQGLWPHRHVAYGATINVDVDGTNRRIYDYQVTNTNTSSPVVGTFIHESGHLICGFPDLYDTNGGSEGVGRHCLMGSGNHLNGGRTPAPIGIYLKDCVGWANLTDLTAGTHHIDPALASTGNLGYRIVKPGTPTELFLFENRGTGPSDPWAAHTPDSGLLIWHVDETKSTNREEDMTPALHYKVSVEQADGDFDLENDRNRGDADDLYDNTTGFLPRLHHAGRPLVGREQLGDHRRGPERAGSEHPGAVRASQHHHRRLAQRRGDDRGERQLRDHLDLRGGRQCRHRPAQGRRPPHHPGHQRGQRRHLHLEPRRRLPAGDGLHHRHLQHPDPGHQRHERRRLRHRDGALRGGRDLPGGLHPERGGDQGLDRRERPCLRGELQPQE